VPVGRVNLQEHFDAVVHYDLTWNPTRLEQREGRADRFGQRSRTVRTLMLYGQNNPVDGAVLRVILKKAEKIRQELGISVPLPADNNKVIEAIMEAVLLHERGDAAQMRLFDQAEREVDQAWETVKHRQERTVFAQRRLRPADVLPEWEKTTGVLGGASDVASFVRTAAQRLGAPLEETPGSARVPVDHLPAALGDRFRGAGIGETTRIGFEEPLEAGARFIHRSHPMVLALADHVAENALQGGDPSVGARSSAAFTREVGERTSVWMLRLRSQLELDQRRVDGRWALQRALLAEECHAVAVRGVGPFELEADQATVLGLLSAEPARNMPDGLKTHQVRQALAALPELQPRFESLARRRAAELLTDHRRVRDASRTTGNRYRVTPCLPVGVIGVYVLLPVRPLQSPAP